MQNQKKNLVLSVAITFTLIIFLNVALILLKDIFKLNFKGDQLVYGLTTIFLVILNIISFVFTCVMLSRTKKVESLKQTRPAYLILFILEKLIGLAFLCFITYLVVYKVKYDKNLINNETFKNIYIGITTVSNCITATCFILIWIMFAQVCKNSTERTNA
ncbi:hypothetical protein [Metamycoplasma hyosynoviae]|uniref:Uncharacterized protein n=1 Tax=Metamycoplasma hyosynoviae TaxID=29559 RepID=A0A4P1QFV1_9BACT|nr:hypothetical protein [Metamycoplasma hyosynoviae]ASI53657.1 hypothetical protein MHSN_00255 [Metamycoplasma hyosynoviae]MDC8900709.1 hypothetical protein [Metamycoplasma hyosynoviae]MDC8912225.1 hypothetical protein [Metamycoplasma hyosynoviae]MDC8913247.1 hypothetical protein [Metamycoplasma hyosynoviae]MDC8914596.1 hypothetical protein [Metamycoplasma hyosynoviae]